MDRRNVLALALGAVGSSLAHAGGEAEGTAPLRIVTSHLPPLVMEPGGEQAGALRELVDVLCRRVGVAPEVGFMPWKRALHLAATMPRTAIFPLTRQDEREAQFRWLAPLYKENYIFMAPQGSGFDVRRPQDMTGKRIALLRGASQSAILGELGFRRLVEASSIDDIHRYLVAGMADAVFGERAMIHSSLFTRGEEKRFRLSETVRSTQAWLAGSLDIGEAEARRYRAAMADLVADGTQRRIFKQYGLA
ncbi:substrate-binding periplasmic protein [Massilia sp. DD77]|uniref:substrate-binding periplasmic protein n=1 Tax=Massilia sp. DD77 TaxID=3109349 RepID=UPI002FFDBD07